jgi:hypothetical protein
MCTKHMGVRLIGVQPIKHRIWDARGPYQTIQGIMIMKQVFRRFRLIRCAYESLRCTRGKHEAPYIEAMPHTRTHFSISCCHYSWTCPNNYNPGDKVPRSPDLAILC